MKMKNMLIGGMSLALVACISVGGTLAYLSDNTGTMTNTFKFGTLEVTQKETDGTTTVNDSGSLTYADLVPGDTVKKEVKISLTDHKVNAYVYVAVKNSNENLVKYGNGDNENFVAGVSSDWTKVESEEVSGYNLYVYSGETDAAKAVNSFEDSVLFANAQVQDAGTGSATVGDDTTIQIASYAIQADHVTDYEDKAIDYFDSYAWN